MADLDVVLKNASDKLNADILIYSGDIDTDGAEKVIDLTVKPTNENILFILCTPGGDPNAAFKIARRLQDKYSSFYLYVYGFCKSAGTLIAIGSDKIIMSDYAEFGPLDVQLQEKDEIARYSSGLNIDEAILNLKEETRQFFRSMLLELTTGAGISTKTAAELASVLSTNFYAPIVSQIDPMRIGEIRRAVKIALAYGERLISDTRGNLKTVKELAKLVESYPDHGFVIDYKEAKTIFKNIIKEEKEEAAIGKSLAKLIKSPRSEIRYIEMIYQKDRSNEEPRNDNKQTGNDGSGKNKASQRKTNQRNSRKVIPAPTKRSAAA